MTTLSTSAPARYSTLCALYVAQGVPFGFVTITLVAWLAKRDVPTGEIATVTAMTSLPWAFKWVWGPLIDAVGIRSMGRRRPWILFAQSCMAVTLLAMILVPDLTAGTRALAIMVALHNVFASIQDVSTDALAVDLLAPHERGRANGLMYGSSYLGTSLGGALSGYLALNFGMRAALVGLVIVLLLIMLFPLLLREREGDRLLPIGGSRGRRGATGKPSRAVEGGDAGEGGGTGGLRAGLRDAFSRSSTWLAAIYALAIKIPVGVVAVVPVVLLTRRLGWSEESYVGMSSVGVWFGLAGSVAGGFLADRLGPRRLALLASAALAGVWFVFAAAQPWWEHRAFVVAVIYTETTLVALVAVSSFAIFMGIAAPAIAATQFTAYMAALNLSQTLGTKLGGWLEPRFATPLVYVGIGILQLLVLPLFLGLRPRESGATAPSSRAAERVA